MLGWNSLGQLTQASRYQKGTATYGYDAFDRRVRRTAPDGTVIRYLYDGDDLLMEVDGAGNSIREYTYLPGVDRPHSVRVSQTGASYYYATDHPGNVIGLIDGADQVVNQYKYGPWGEPELVNGPIEQPLGYTAREWDATAGLYQVRARWYDPQIGRFVSEDPMGLAGGMNPYAYAANSPLNFTDPSGMAAVAVVQMDYDDIVDILERLGAGLMSPMPFALLGGAAGSLSGGPGKNREIDKCPLVPRAPRGASVVTQE